MPKPIETKLGCDDGRDPRAIPVVLLLASSSRYPAALGWTRAQAQAAWGRLQLESSPFDFDQTRYYQPTMGDGLQKQLLAFAQLIDPACLSQLKAQTNAWEATYQQLSAWPEPRPLNLDPGYISEGKLVLASTKDHAHRIYLNQGIYAEITLRFQSGRWQSQPWTYPDYQSSQYQAFFDRCREYLRSQLGRSVASRD